MQLATPNILFKRTPLPIPTAAEAQSLFFILVCNCLLGILLKEAVELGSWLYQSRRLHREAVELIPETTEA